MFLRPEQKTKKGKQKLDVSAELKENCMILNNMCKQPWINRKKNLNRVLKLFFLKLLTDALYTNTCP